MAREITVSKDKVITLMPIGSSNGIQIWKAENGDLVIQIFDTPDRMMKAYLKASEFMVVLDVLEGKYE